MRVILLLLLLIFTSNVVLSQNVINSRLFFTNEDQCSSSGEPSTPTPKIFCPEDTFQSYSGGFIVKENQCMYIRHFSKNPTTFSVSSDSKSIIESVYHASDYYCKDSSNSKSYTVGECHENCTRENQAYKFELTVTDELIIPDNAILTIHSSSDQCETDWKTSYNFISYTNVRTCINTQFGSMFLECNGQGYTSRNYNCSDCRCTPEVYNGPLKTDFCSDYQVCTYIN